MKKPEKTNYEVFSEAASKRFLTFDQDAIIQRFGLSHDKKSIFIGFLDREYRIDRGTGIVYLLTYGSDKESGTNAERASMEAALSIFDMLCRSPYAPHMSGEWVSLGELASKTGAGPSDPSLFGKRLERFEGRTESLSRACERMGGIEKKVGDVSFELPVFEGFNVWFQYWDADDEFPASVRFLWDKTTPQHLHYETLWYIMGEVMKRLCSLDGK